jgi:hypothetical protein
MSFDSRSLERLRELGRQLPQPLPAPQARPAAAPQQRLHAVETEQDPDKLFHELIKASPDGKVPPHLMERLTTLETARRERQRQQPPAGAPAGAGAAPAVPGGLGPVRTTRKPLAGAPAAAAIREHEQLYREFHSLLLEDEPEI